jgi:hypothetical protein
MSLKNRFDVEPKFERFGITGINDDALQLITNNK